MNETREQCKIKETSTHCLHSLRLIPTRIFPRECRQYPSNVRDFTMKSFFHQNFISSALGAWAKNETFLLSSYIANNSSHQPCHPLSSSVCSACHLTRKNPFLGKFENFSVVSYSPQVLDLLTPGRCLAAPHNSI